MRIKRIGRIVQAPVAARTKVALLRAEFNVARADLSVRVGDAHIEIAKATRRVDYFTLFGVLLDRHFDDDVAGTMVLDIGAHKGYYAARALADGAAGVQSYEPASQNLVHLNAAAASLSTWAVHPVAVGADDGTAILNIAPGSWGHSIHEPVGGVIASTEEVEVRSLRSILRSRPTSHELVVKINVEGAAGAMIIGTAPEDWAAVRSLWADIEVNDPIGASAIIEHLQTCGLSFVRNEVHRHYFRRS